MTIPGWVEAGSHIELSMDHDIMKRPTISKLLSLEEGQGKSISLASSANLAYVLIHLVSARCVSALTPRSCISERGLIVNST